jgi:anti-sigma28 factor (negative regulator of flagellin synthesis)
MINPIRGGGFNFEPKRDIKNLSKRKEKKSVEDEVVLEIQNVEIENLSASQKVEKLKKLIKEGKYPLDPQKVAEKLINFLTDVG